MKKLLLLLTLTVVLFGQSLKENWMPITESTTETTYINTEGLKKFMNGDIYVWVLQEHSPPLQMEGVDGDIYKTKTYYLFNDQMKRYGIEQIIYYDEDGDVLKSYSYSKKTNLPQFKYNFPVFKGTNEEVVLSKILELTGDNN